MTFWAFELERWATEIKQKQKKGTGIRKLPIKAYMVANVERCNINILKFHLQGF